jgi:hypothetical protein
VIHYEKRRWVVKLVVATLALLATAMMPASAVSQRAIERGIDSHEYEYDTCLQKAADRLSLNQQITVVQRDKDSTAAVVGLLEAINPAQGTLLLRILEDDQSRTLSFSNDQINAIQYRGIGKVQWSWAAYGAVAGAALGAGIGAALGEEETTGAFGSFDSISKADAAFLGALAGFIGGAILGPAISPLFPSTKTLRCE